MTAEEKLKKFINRLVALSDYFLEKEKQVMFSSVYGVHSFTVVEIPDTLNEALEAVRFVDKSVLDADIETLRKAFAEIEKEKDTSRVVRITLKELVKKLVELKNANS